MVYHWYSYRLACDLKGSRENGNNRIDRCHLICCSPEANKANLALAERGLILEFRGSWRKRSFTQDAKTR